MHLLYLKKILPSACNLPKPFKMPISSPSIRMGACTITHDFNEQLGVSIEDNRCSSLLVDHIKMESHLQTSLVFIRCLVAVYYHYDLCCHDQQVLCKTFMFFSVLSNPLMFSNKVYLQTINT